MQNIILTSHHDDGRHIARVGKNQSPTTLVETFQRNLRKLGYPDGVTWKVQEGGLVKALIASR